MLISLIYIVKTNIMTDVTWLSKLSETHVRPKDHIELEFKLQTTKQYLFQYRLTTEATINYIYVKLIKKKKLFRICNN